MLIMSSFSAGPHTTLGHTWEVKLRRMNTKCVYLAEGEGSMQMMVVETDEDGIIIRETARKPDAIVSMCGFRSTRLLRKTEVMGTRTHVGTHTRRLANNAIRERLTVLHTGGNGIGAWSTDKTRRPPEVQQENTFWV